MKKIITIINFKHLQTKNTSSSFSSILLYNIIFLIYINNDKNNYVPRLLQSIKLKSINRLSHEGKRITLLKLITLELLSQPHFEASVRMRHTPKKWEFGVLRDSRNFKARQ
jgi:hypothetical protein